MAATLAQTLLAPETRPHVTDDCVLLIEAEVAEKSGISGTAVKIAYKSVKAVAPGHIRKMVASLLPDLVQRLEPYWADFAASGGGSFGDYLAKRAPEVSEDLLAVTDARAQASSRGAVKKAYGSVRGGAAKHIQAALPQVGELVAKYAA